MIFIAHRGNIEGPSLQENNPSYITKTLTMGFHVEIDVWLVDGIFVLGHDEPQYEIQDSFLLNNNMWHHAKNIEALHKLIEININYPINCFYHQNDDCVLTSNKWIWTYPGKPIISHQSIAVMPETVNNWDISKAGGICSDHIKEYCDKYIIL